MNNITNIKNWLDYLFYKVGNQNYDFELQINNLDGFKSKRKKYSEVCFNPCTSESRWFLERVNQRQTFPIELDIDLEFKDNLISIIKELKSLDLNFYIFDTHSRGVHIVIFFNRELSEDEKLRMIRHFGGDSQLASNRHMIALEFSEHWKSHQIKDLVDIDKVLNGN